MPLHPGNVMTDGRMVFYVIDWGNAGAGCFLRDLGWCLAATRAWFGNSDLILNGFLTIRPLREAAVYELRIWESYFLLMFAVGLKNAGEEASASRMISAIEM